MYKEEITLKDGTVLKRRKLYTIETFAGRVYQCRICSIDGDGSINITTIKTKEQNASSLIIYAAGIKSAKELKLNKK